MASALYNAPEGLTIGELGEWLGHKDLRSTQHYARIQPTRLAKSIARANKNSRLVQVIVDPAAVAKGQPAIFYYLGDGAYCANPAWASCPHRMACLKCPMYVAKEPAELIEARDGILRLMQEVPLTDEESSVAEGDVKALNRYIENRKHVSPPPVPSEFYIFNSLSLIESVETQSEISINTPCLTGAYSGQWVISFSGGICARRHRPCLDGFEFLVSPRRRSRLPYRYKGEE